MPLEQEVTGLMIGGFSTIMGAAFVTVLFLWFRKKEYRRGYAWTLLYLVLTSIVFYFVIQAISFDYTHPMASEESSLIVGTAGIVWAVSMICLLVGIYSLSKARNAVSGT